MRAVYALGFAIVVVAIVVAFSKSVTTPAQSVSFADPETQYEPRGNEQPGQYVLAPMELKVDRLVKGVAQ